MSFVNLSTLVPHANADLHDHEAWQAPAGQRESFHTIGAPVDGLALKFHWYGSYCGPGVGDPGDIAVDGVDEACAAHDAGYGSRGRYDALSDQLLMHSIPAAILDPHTSTEGRYKAAGMVVAFGALSPFTGLTTTVWNPGSDFIDDWKKHGFGTATFNFAMRPVHTFLDAVTGASSIVMSAVETAKQYGGALAGLGSAFAGGVSSVVSGLGNFFGGFF
jgi:hypothetical protein